MRTLRLAALAVFILAALLPANSSDEWEARTKAAIERIDAQDFSGAEKELKAALRLAEKAGQKDPRIARSHANLGRLYHATKKMIDAEGSLKKAVEASEKIDGPESRIMLPYLGEIGFFYLQWAQGTLEWSRGTVAITTTHKIVQYTPIAPARGMTTTTYVPAGGAPKWARLALAEKNLVRALAIRDKNPETLPAEVVQNALLLADVRRYQEDVGGMVADYARILSIDEQNPTADHGHLPAMISRLEKFHSKKDHAAQIEALFGRVIALLERQHGPEHRNVAAVVHNLGVLYLLAQKYQQAEPLFARSVAIYEKALGPQHATLRIPLLNWAKTLKALGREQEAQKAEDRAKSL